MVREWNEKRESVKFSQSRWAPYTCSYTWQVINACSLSESREFPQTGIEIIDLQFLHIVLSKLRRCVTRL